MIANAETEFKDRKRDISMLETDKAAHARANRNLYKVLPVRLPVDKWERIGKEANELGIGPSTLARIWILDSLRKLANGNERPKKQPVGAKDGSGDTKE